MPGRRTSTTATAAARNESRTGGSYHVFRPRSSPHGALRAVRMNVAARDIQDVAGARLSGRPVPIEEVRARRGRRRAGRAAGAPPPPPPPPSVLVWGGGGRPPPPLRGFSRLPLRRVDES